MSHLFGKRANSTLYSIKCSLNCEPLQAMLEMSLIEVQEIEEALLH